MNEKLQDDHNDLAEHLRLASIEAKDIARKLMRYGLESVLSDIAPWQIEKLHSKNFEALTYCSKARVDLAIVKASQFIQEHNLEQTHEVYLIKEFQSEIINIVNAPSKLVPRARTIWPGEFFPEKRLAQEIAQRLLVVVHEAEEAQATKSEFTLSHGLRRPSQPFSIAEIVKRWYDREESHPERKIDAIKAATKVVQISPRRYIVELHGVETDRVARLEASKYWTPSKQR